MSFPIWRYGAYAFAIAVTACLAVANVAWAWGLDDGVYRYVMIAVSVTADVGAPCALMAMMYHHGNSDPTSALAAFVVWAMCGYAEVRGAETWLRSNMFMVSSPSAKAAEEKRVADLDTTREETNLSEIRKQLSVERREVRLDDLHKREKESLSRIEKLRPRTFTTNIAPAATQYDGNELCLAIALWLLSQAAWRVAVGRAQRAPKTPRPDSPPLLDPEAIALARAFMEARDKPLAFRPHPIEGPRVLAVLEDKTGETRHRDTEARQIETPRQDTETRHRDTETPRHVQDTQAPETKEKDTEAPTRQDSVSPVSRDKTDQDDETRQRNSETAERDAARQQDETARQQDETARHPDRDGKTGPRLVALPSPADEKTELKRKVAELSRAGVSVRQIASRLGVDKGVVERLRRDLRITTTSGGIKKK